MIENLIYITLIIVGIYYSGFPFEIEDIINKHVKIGKFKLPKPFSCQLCMTWWTTLIYIIVTHNFSLENIFICIILALSTNAVESAYRLVLDTIETIIIKIDEYLNQ